MLALIAEALAVAGGVPLKVLADRMDCLTGGVVANVVARHRTTCGSPCTTVFAPGFCHGNDPESKGIVENLVGYAQRDLLEPLLTEAKVTGRPVDAQGQHRRRPVAGRGERRGALGDLRSPDTRLLKEREVLRPLPSLRLEIGAAPITRKVDRLSCVRFASARYTVTTRLIGSTVRLVQRTAAGC